MQAGYRRLPLSWRLNGYWSGCVRNSRCQTSAPSCVKHAITPDELKNQTRASSAIGDHEVESLKAYICGLARP